MSDEPQTQLAAPAAMADLATLTDEQLAAREAAIIRAAEVKKRLVKAAMHLLYPTDFVALGDKMYLQGEGAMRLAGVGLTLSTPIYQVEKHGDDYFVECLVEAEWPACGQAICETGTCNTRDKFWNADSERSEINQIRQRAEGNEALARRMLLGHIKKKAYMNAVSRAVTGVMGIRGLTNEQLADAGFTPEKAGAQVKYKAKKGAKKSTGALETVDTAGLLALADASEVSVRAKLLSAEITDKGTKYIVGDVSKKASLMSKKSDPLPEWCVGGATVFFPLVKSSAYQGRTYYWVNASPELADDAE